METRRLELLAELSRLGSMHAVADALGTTTSTVSQQLAALAREMGTQLIEPDGRRVRLTPAGRLLAEHAVTILAEVEEARRDLAPGGEPAGTLRVAGFTTAIRGYLLPVIAGLAASHPRIHVLIREHETAEALQLLAADQADLALIYDFNLAPVAIDPAITPSPLWTAPWGLAVPAREAAGGGTAPEVFARFRARDWIGNSRSTADEDVIRTLASMAGFIPRITHRADSLDLIQDMITAGLGVGLLPLGHPVQPGVRLLPLAGPRIELRAYAAARRGRLSWPPLALVTSLVRQVSRQATGDLGHSPPVVRDEEFDLIGNWLRPPAPGYVPAHGPGRAAAGHQQRRQVQRHLGRHDREGGHVNETDTQCAWIAHGGRQQAGAPAEAENQRQRHRDRSENESRDHEGIRKRPGRVR
jgi:DNA-binding transcriptional LysR family regulator